MNSQLNDFLTGKTHALLFDLDGELSPFTGRSDVLIFAGSFNPMHRGHARMFRLAQNRTGLPGYLEISMRNVDKSVLVASDLEDRLEKIKGQFRVILTHAPRFIEKAELFKNCTFLMGYDTAKRLLDPTYCKEQCIEDLLSIFQQLKVKFLIAGRTDGETFLTRKDLNIPPGFESLFEGIGADLFREDISSTEIRKSRN